MSVVDGEILPTKRVVLRRLDREECFLSRSGSKIDVYSFSAE